MRRLVRFSIAARRELDAYADYIARDSADAARRFVQSARLTADDLTVFAYAGRRVWFRRLKLLGIRKFCVTGFPNHMLIYRVSENTIDVCCVTNGARNLPRVLNELWKDSDRELF